ncbi:MAG: metal ABC transporter substrate-binding protein [Clostridia bacterium]|nr:metal ABC transporter substrate-binding protein [Clostridia bacterium]
MLRKIFSISIVIITVLIILTACASNNNTDKTDDDKLKIVATVFPAYDFARAVAKDRAEIKMLMKPGGEVHSYSPTADDMLCISQCDLFICIGGESDEDWVEDSIEASGNTDVTVIKMTDCVNTLEEGESIEPEEDADDEEEKDDDDEKEVDEHIWTSPENAIKIVDAIAKAVSALDTKNTDFYNSNAGSYDEQLLKLDEQFKEIAADANIKTLVFADRFPFRYFCEEYGFNYVAAFSGCSASADPSAETITTLVNKVRELNTKTVFTIEFSSGATADTVCEATGAEKAELHSCHNVSQQEFDSGITYIDLMSRNINTLKEVVCNGSD